MPHARRKKSYSRMNLGALPVPPSKRNTVGGLGGFESLTLHFLGYRLIGKPEDFESSFVGSNPAIPTNYVSVA